MLAPLFLAAPYPLLHCRGPVETVSRTVTKFRVDGLIELAQGVMVMIVDKNALEHAASRRC